MRPWRPPFHASPAARKGPISSKRVSSQDPLLRKFGNFSLYSLNFHPNLNSQASKFGNFQLTKPRNLEIFRSQAPLFRGKCQFASPTLRKSGPHTPTGKKLSPPPGQDILFRFQINHTMARVINFLFIFCTQSFVVVFAFVQFQPYYTSCIILYCVIIISFRFCHITGCVSRSALFVINHHHSSAVKEVTTNILNTM